MHCCDSGSRNLFCQDISPNVTVKDLSGNNVLMKDVLTGADRTVLQKLGNDCLTF